VLAQQSSLVLFSLAQLGLTGVGIDFIRSCLSSEGGAAMRWPLGWQPPANWPPLAVVGLISAAILVFAVAHAAIRYWGAVRLSNLVQRIVINLRSEVYNKLQRLSFRFFDANQSGSIINRVAGDVQAVRQFVDGVILQVLTVLLSLAFYLI
jgi:ATP-binding cassette, subfamily B, bacterial